ncbi:hypothetical protein PCC8801_1781 [Rippkaea orientalis PCC 8801]|nr:hypothetical protein [Rippkaea orientalis]ACK65827.1 hypothetical protein PCC8801_1781 [Rippkaea orientalis PCC 8801]
MSQAVVTCAPTVKGKDQSSTFNSSLSITQDNNPSHCYSCVDDYPIPPCTGFSKDYSCLPNVDNHQQN